ncbi:MAG: hypothetical protein WC683_14410 [bacterium]
MGISRIFKALAAIACSVTILGVNVILLDDYSTPSDEPTTVAMAPITTPVLEAISATEEQPQAQYPQPIVIAQPNQTAASQSIN